MGVGIFILRMGDEATTATICMTRIGKTSRDQRWNNGTSGHSDTGKDLLHIFWDVFCTILSNLCQICIY
jgi:hypothetical protein